MLVKKTIVILKFLILLSIASPVLARPINPAPRPEYSESDLDRYFRIAFQSAVDADFNTAIINYRRAAAISSDQCDRRHAQAGVQAATEARSYQREALRNGQAGLPTQQFTIRLEALALPLPCTTIRDGRV